MDACPRCGSRVNAAGHFCSNCGAQVRVQPLKGEVVGADRGQDRSGLPNPLKAALLSVVPGLGHWYSGAPARGAIFFLAIVGPEVLGIELDLSVVGAAIGIPLELGGLVLWAFCAVDAYRTARRHSEQAG